uniref:Uncharacterized protein n=1 Tax=Triticum urartu TaxID=4572 RepID=A0A8R7PCB9_TRIUA
MELDNYYETIHKRDKFMFLFGLAAGFMFAVSFMLDNPATDYYSVNLTGVTASSTTSPPALNFTLHVETKVWCSKTASATGKRPCRTPALSSEKGLCRACAQSREGREPRR